MANPSISLPDDMVEEIDDRRHSTVYRSEWIREAVMARFLLEDAGSWEEVARRLEVSAEN